ncbi:MAG: hypothetical protein J6P98_00835 [Clostridia bacterium]|nr:hypothetical protein [Clostridia bacterium]
MLTIRKKKKRRARRRRPFNKRLLWIIPLILLLIAGIVYLFLHFIGAESSAGTGAMQFKLTDKNLIIIRNETIVSASAHSRLDFLAQEGDRVSAGDPVATVYKLGYSDELMQSLLSLRETAYAAQIERLGSTKDARLEEMDEDISQLKNEVADKLISGGGEDLQALYVRLDKLLKERMEYLRVKVQENETLRSIYNDIAAQEQLISTWTETATAPVSGTVSYYFDGYDSALDSENFGMISYSLLRRAIKETGSSVWHSNDGTSVCRIVDTEKWYAVFLTAGSDPQRSAAGVEYQLDIKGYGSFTGVAQEPIINSDNVINIIEVNAEMGELISARVVKANITATVTGLTVYRQGVTVENNVPYLSVVSGKDRRSVPVDVLAVSGETAVIRPHNTGDVLSEGVRYWYSITLFKKK